jgi:AcrR family transcriptional regulator
MPAPVPEHRILEAVLDVWTEEGYAGATTRKVAEAAGVSEVTLFRRFGDKVELFKAALALEAAAFTQAAIEHTGDLQADLTRIVETYDSLLSRRGRLIVDFLLEAPRREELRTIAPIPLQAVGQVAALIERYQASGHLRGANPWEGVLALLSPLIVAALLRTAQPSLDLSAGATSRVHAFLQGWRRFEADER